MDANFNTSLAFTMQQEGGFADNPADPGGATMFGITLATYRDWMGNPSLTADDLRNISGNTVSAIAGTNYWNPVRGGSLPNGVDLMVFDYGFNAGPGTSARVLQHAIGFTGSDVDGSIGPMTLGAVARFDPSALCAALHDAQIVSYHQQHNWPSFGQGWTNRTNARLAAAKALLPSTIGA